MKDSVDQQHEGRRIETDYEREHGRKRGNRTRSKENNEKQQKTPAYHSNPKAPEEGCRYTDTVGKHSKIA